MMLWYSTKPLEKQMKEAARYYKNKYGQEPDVYFAHPSMGEADGVVHTKYLMPNHILIGVKDGSEGLLLSVRSKAQE